MEKKAINYKSCFDIIGPIMIGPSSSHTAGAVQMGLLARQLFGGTPEYVTCVYYESFAQTHKGHGTDYAIISGILGFATDDNRVPNAVDIAKKQGIKIEFVEMSGESPISHANTADLTLRNQEKEVRIIAASVGGGTVELRFIEVEGLALKVTGPLPVIAVVTENIVMMQVIGQLLEEEGIEPLHTRFVEKYEKMLCVYELNDVLTDDVKEKLKRIDSSATVYILD